MCSYPSFLLDIYQCYLSAWQIQPSWQASITRSSKLKGGGACIRVPVLSAQHLFVLRQTELAACFKQATMKSKQSSSERINGNTEIVVMHMVVIHMG